MIAAFLVLAATVASGPRLETFALPAGHLPTEIVRHGDVMTFVSWKDWPALEPHLGRITMEGRMEMQAFPKDHMPGLMSQAPDGTLWISEGKKPLLWHVAKSGELEQISIARPTLGIGADPSGAIWTTHPGSAEITRYDASGAVQQAAFVGRRYGRSAAPSAAIPKPRTGAMPIPQKKDSSRSLTKEERQALTRDARPSWIVSGPDGAMWFCEPTWKSIGRITAAGDVKLFNLPAAWGEPRQIAAAPDGVLWFTVKGLPIVGNIVPSGEARMVDIPEPADALAIDRAGRVWVAMAGYLTWIDGDGALHPVELPKAQRLIRSMAEGPDGAMWFADQTAKVIGRVTLPPAAPGGR